MTAPGPSIHAFVDWENLRFRLDSRGFGLSPVRILAALVAALQAAAAGHGLPLERVLLYFSPSAESRADRLALGRSRLGVPVMLQVAGQGRNMAGAAMVLGIADAWHERPDTGLLIVSGDSDLAFAAAHYAARDPGKRPVELLHPGQSAPPIPGAHRPVARPLNLRLVPTLRRRAWTSWDQAAWTLRQLAAHASSRVAASLLDGWEASWPATRDSAAIDWARLERVDDLVAALWRHGNGRPLSWAEALTEATARLGRPPGEAAGRPPPHPRGAFLARPADPGSLAALGERNPGAPGPHEDPGGPGPQADPRAPGPHEDPRGPGPHEDPTRPPGPQAASTRQDGREADAGHDAWAALLALWAAGLLRDTGAGALEVPSGWREGLLLPARRLVLHLDHRTPPVQSVANLRRLHRSRFYTVADADESARKLELVSSADSWDWVTRALRERLDAVAEETMRRAGDGRASAVWRLRPESGFVARTVRTAREVRAALTTPLATSTAEARLVARGVNAPKRWLRCLRDTGLVRWDASSGTWSARGRDLPTW